jgi:hypothetical protein
VSRLAALTLAGDRADGIGYLREIRISDLPLSSAVHGATTWT